MGDHAFFVAALFGAPTLWAEAREAAREGHLLDAAQKSVTAARRSLSEPLEYEFGERCMARPKPWPWSAR